MSPIPWQPMPETEHLEDTAPREAAQIRARYRNQMALRWRTRQARDEDRRAGRLPQDWHDWMGCPGYEGYNGPCCTCDTWGTAKQARAEQLARRAPSNRGQQRTTPSATPERIAILSGKSADFLPKYVLFYLAIDCVTVLPIVAPHAADTTGIAQSRLAGGIPRKRRLPGSDPSRLGSRSPQGLPRCESAWLPGIRRRVPLLWRDSGRARGVVPGPR